MTPDQIVRVTALHDALFEATMADAAPENWTAHGIKPKDMTASQRGDAKWCRTLAMATMGLMLQVRRLLANPVEINPTEPMHPRANPDETPEEEIARFEVAAGKVLDRMRNDSKH